MTFITRVVVVKQAVARKKTCDQARDTVMLPVLVDMKLNRDEGPPRGCQNDEDSTDDSQNSGRHKQNKNSGSSGNKLRFFPPSLHGSLKLTLNCLLRSHVHGPGGQRALSDPFFSSLTVRCGFKRVSAHLRHLQTPVIVVVVYLNRRNHHFVRTFRFLLTSSLFVRALTGTSHQRENPTTQSEQYPKK